MNDFIKSSDIRPLTATDEVYHSLPSVSASSLKRLKVSPAHYKYGEKIEETPAMRFGSAYHKYVLEPDKFAEEYYVFDDDAIYQVLIGEGFKSPRSTKQYKEWAESEMRLIGDRKTVDKADYQRIVDMRERLIRHPYARMLISGGINEQAYAGTIGIDAGEVNIRLKPDHINEAKKFIVDLKTARDVSLDGFSRAAASLDYHIQAAFYSDMMELHAGDSRRWRFIFIAQEQIKPYAFNIFEASPQFIQQGRYEYELLVQLYKYCTDNNRWPGYQVFCENKYGILELNLPPFAIRNLDYYIHD